MHAVLQPGADERLTALGVAAACSGAIHGMEDAHRAATFTQRTLCSGAIHFSEEAPLLKKLSCDSINLLTIAASQ